MRAAALLVLLVGCSGAEPVCGSSAAQPPTCDPDHYTDGAGVIHRWFAVCGDDYYLLCSESGVSGTWTEPTCDVVPGELELETACADGSSPTCIDVPCDGATVVDGPGPP